MPLEPSYLTHWQVIFELKSHNLPPLSIWFPSELLSQGSTWFLSNWVEGGKGKSLRAWGDSLWAESRWEWQGAQQWPLWNMILTVSHVSASPFLPSSLPHSQPNVIKSLHFLTCHSQPCPLHSDWPSISPPLLPGDHLGPLSLPGDVFQPSSYLPCQQHPLTASFLDFFYLPLQICASSFHPTLGCWLLSITATGSRTLW